MREVIHFGKNKIIFAEGDYEPCMYYLNYGEVGVFQNYKKPGERYLATIREGFVGELGLIENENRIATAVALEECALTRITNDDIEDFFRENQAKLFYLLQNISDRITATNHRYMDVCEKIRSYQVKELGTSEETVIEKKKGIYREGKIIYQAGEIISHEGVYESWMYQILSGRVAIYKNYGHRDQQKLAEITDGYVGEMGLITASPRSATILAVEETCVRMMNEDTLGEYFRTHPQKIREIMQILSRRMRELDNNLEEAYRVAAEYQEAERKQAPKSKSLMNSIRKFGTIFQRMGNIS